MSKEETEHNEIIIVRRSGGDHDDHHGGVWKIAFADFMTAMMAFFLVMWLINASNEETRQALASYFNPIKLMDTTSNPKGVRNPKYGVEVIEIEKTEDDSTKVSQPEKQPVVAETVSMAYDEQSLFVDPFSLLSEIEAGINEKSETLDIDDEQNANKERSVSFAGGELFQDPFDPSEWNIREGSPAMDEQSSGTDGDGGPGFQEELRSVDGEMASGEETDQAGDQDNTQENKPAQQSVETGDVPPEVGELVEDLQEKVEALKDEIDISNLDLEIQESTGGATVILSDKSQSGMFKIGSAKPSPELVRIMSKIGDAVARHDGDVEIWGHTDGRQYQSGDYDNWRLSTARAHMAYYMLVRGGMREDQVKKIIGQADVNLKNPNDPFSPTNRRIEVVLRLQ